MLYYSITWLSSLSGNTMQWQDVRGVREVEVASDLGTLSYFSYLTMRFRFSECDRLSWAPFGLGQG